VHGWWLGGAVIAVAATTAIGEKGEEARFVYAILPALLAAAGQALAGALALTRDSPPST
jgi:hypothetical protein